MHVLFVHNNFPAQFGHIARHLVQNKGFECSFVCEHPSADVDGVRRIQYQAKGGATKATHYCSRTFENATWHAWGVYEAMKAHPEIKPDLIVGHSGFGSTLWLADLYDRPIINYFEYYYRGHGSDLDYRPEYPANEMSILRSRARNAMILLDLQTCTRGYSPTNWQRELFPDEYQPKLETIFDGIDTDLWHRRDVPRKIANREIPADTKIVTYVSRGFESMRGFDIFMKVAKRICDTRSDVVFVVVGSDRVAYGGDLNHIEEQSFREHVLKQDNYDLSRFIFTGRIPTPDLVNVLSLSDLHIYLTVPFVLSWSLMNALSVGCTVLASDTAPVQEMIEHEQNGLLAGFADVDALTAEAMKVLDDPAAFRHLGQAGMEMIQEHYSLEKKTPQLLDLFERTVNEASRS
ncbi:D-inositol-3-phosphate glycosyltransferase [Symmachiella dynata]|uniref:D-inositol-3-phosphate glycosyltransferase n=1 Tax=Symmachiella dynata TaxID=2527995 RepID=A0A517ZR11_9PLAN|nr:glycosyltransferase [Symmachiella dynata]QDU44921.1 D-inositol-3-phosphate glycosyltransferase [Symmachiella dynata]